MTSLRRTDRVNSTWVALTFSPDPVALYSPEPPSGGNDGAPPDYDGGGEDPMGHTVNIFALETEDEVSDVINPSVIPRG